MDKRTAIEKLKTMATSPSCAETVKQAIKVYLSALALEQVAFNNLITALDDNVVTVDELIKNSEDTEHAIEYFGVEGAKKFAANAAALKASGAKYCNCLACTIALEILNNKNVLHG